MRKTGLSAVCSLLIVAFASTPTLAQDTAEQSKDFGDFVVHYNAFSTDLLPADVARSYQIVRSANRALLNVVILRKEEGTTGVPVTAEVVVRVSNLAGQLKDVTMRLVQEQDAIYYIGEVSVSDGETLVFDIEVTPADEVEPRKLRFQQQFYGS